MCLFCSSLELLEVHKNITDDYYWYRHRTVNITYGDKQVEKGKIRVSLYHFFPAKNKCVITRSCAGSSDKLITLESTSKSSEEG